MISIVQSAISVLNVETDDLVEAHVPGQSRQDYFHMANMAITAKIIFNTVYGYTVFKHDKAINTSERFSS